MGTTIGLTHDKIQRADRFGTFTPPLGLSSSSQSKRVICSLSFGRIIRLPSRATCSTTDRARCVFDCISSSLGSVSYTFSDASKCIANPFPKTCIPSALLQGLAPSECLPPTASPAVLVTPEKQSAYAWSSYRLRRRSPETPLPTVSVRPPRMPPGVVPRLASHLKPAPG
jgi:hypothetical protein